MKKINICLLAICVIVQIPSTLKSQSVMAGYPTDLNSRHLFSSFDSITIEFAEPAITNTYMGVDLTVKNDYCIVITRKGERHCATKESKGWIDLTNHFSEIHDTALYDEFVNLIDRLFIARKDSIYDKIENRTDGCGDYYETIFPLTCYAKGGQSLKFFVVVWGRDCCGCLCYYSETFKQFLRLFESMLGIKGCLSDELL